MPTVSFKHLAANHPSLPPNAAVQKSDGTYKIVLSPALSVLSPGKTSVNGVKHFKLNEHVFFSPSNGWKPTGKRSEQQTTGAKTGMMLTSNIELLPLSPMGYEPPPLWTEPKKSFAVANVYQDCEGMCFAVTMARVKKAYADAMGINALSLATKAQDYNFSGTGTVNRSFIPSKYFGYGVGGALAVKGYANLVTNDEVWNGALQEGALIQYWWGSDPALITKQNFSLSGHSIIFKGYIFDAAGNIAGFQHYDYHGVNRQTIKATSGKVFFAANLKDRK